MIKNIFIGGAFIGAVLLTFWTFSSTPICANAISCTRDLSGKYNSTQTTGEYLGQKIAVPENFFIYRESNILGITTSPKPKKILVDLTAQKLYAYEGNSQKFEFTISSGRSNPTPTGKFYIWAKLYATQMEGGEKANKTYYRFPNVPYTMYFYNENVGKWNGYGLHGIYWDTRLGQPITNGCIGLRVEDAEKLFYWTDPQPLDTVTFAANDASATPIIIFGKAPLVL